MTHTNSVQPRLAVLYAEQMERVHNHSLQLHSSVGVRTDSDRAQHIVVQAIGPTMADGNCLRIARELVEWALEVTLAELDIHDRTGALAFRLPDRARFGCGVTALYCQRPETDDVTPFTRKHMGAVARGQTTIDALGIRP